MTTSLGNIRKLRTRLLTLLAIVALAFISLVPPLVQLINERNKIEIHLQTISSLTSDIIYYDEVLTMSSRMYTFTQAQHWRARYQSFANKLDNALKEVSQLEPAVAKVIASTASINESLIEIELKAFAQTEASPNFAQSILLDDNYQKLKQQYRTTTHQALERAITFNQEKLASQTQKKLNVLTILLVILSVLFIAIAIYFVRHNRYTDDHINQLVSSLNNNLRQVNDVAAKLEKANEAKSLLLANMSHELRTPINGIYGSLQLLRQKQLDEETEQLIETSMSCSKMLATIVNDILDFTKIEAGKLTLESAPFDITQMINAIGQIYQQECARKGVIFNLESTVIKRFRSGDALRLKQILLNLLNNSVKFTQEGSVSLIVDETGTKDGLRFEVIDTGIGMTQSAVDKLFDKFEQADTSTTRLYGGTGLGMSIVKSLVKLMQGSIAVSSEENVGTSIVFNIDLPVTNENMEDVRTNEEEHFTSLSELTVLVAEDNLVNQTIINKMLNHVGIVPTIANNGQQAIEMITSQFDLVLMDIQMPVKDGYQACEYIKALYPSLPIIAVTASVLKEEIEQYIEFGFDAVLPKPIEQAKLYALLKQFSR